MVAGDGVVQAEDVGTTPQATRGPGEARPTRLDDGPHEVLVVQPGVLSPTTIHTPIITADHGMHAHSAQANSRQSGLASPPSTRQIRASVTALHAAWGASRPDGGMGGRPAPTAAKSGVRPSRRKSVKNDWVDKQEALGVLERRLSKLRLESYSDLVAEWLDRSDLEQLPGQSGVVCQVKVEGDWDDPGQQGGNLRILGLIDDGGWRAFAPLTDSFIVAPDGSFIGE
jgi:hypothetical protein